MGRSFWEWRSLAAEAEQGDFAVQAAYFQLAEATDASAAETAVTVKLMRDGVRFPEGGYRDHAREYAIDNAQVEHASAEFSSSAQMKVETASDDEFVGSFNARQPLADGGTAQLSGTFDAVRCEVSASE